jgi:hypothetical protein
MRILLQRHPTDTACTEPYNVIQKQASGHPADSSFVHKRQPSCASKINNSEFQVGIRILDADLPRMPTKPQF